MTASGQEYALSASPTQVWNVPLNRPSLRLKRMAAICAAEDHLIERVNGGLGP
jgi:hypothetical protein